MIFPVSQRKFLWLYSGDHGPNGRPGPRGLFVEAWMASGSRSAAYELLLRLCVASSLEVETVAWVLVEAVPGHLGMDGRWEIYRNCLGFLGFVGSNSINFMELYLIFQDLDGTIIGKP